MRKRCVLLLVIVVCIGYFNVYAQHYHIELNAFTHTINTTLFHYAGYETTLHEQIDKRTKHYFSGHYDSYIEAEQAHKIAFKKGFINARIIDTKRVAFTATTVANNYHSYTNNRLFIRAVSLKNGKGKIAMEERKDLQNIVNILRANPYLKVRILHLEGEGNILPAQKLQLMANFLLANGIAAYRIRITNAHHDFVTAVQALTATGQKEGGNNKIVLTLINHKEEIVKDVFEWWSSRQFSTMPIKELSLFFEMCKYMKWS